MMRLETLFLVFCGLLMNSLAQDEVCATTCNGDFDFYLLLDT